ncbi:MAG: DUF378 domain-containing protein [Candidatus Pacebacteria bacterium]|nr:DUF378 domain-containing protein [Candidatus Paceibacterota bacterium]
MKALHTIAFILVVIGGINWGLVGVANFDLVALLPMMLAKIVYILVGISAILLVVTHKKSCKDCTTSSAPTM